MTRHEQLIGLQRVVVLGATLLIATISSGDDNARPNAQEARAAYAIGTRFVDVRTDAEWIEGHVKDAVHLPLDQVDAVAASVLPEKSAPLILYCGTGKRAQIAADILREQGYTHVVAMTGGYKDLEAAGYPVAR